MIQQAQAELPNECCGLLAGLIEETGAGFVSRVIHRYPLVNEAASPVEFHCENSFPAHKDMRKQGTDLLAIYHSHPTSDPVPSNKDLERNYWPDALHVIISLKSSIPHMRAWLLGEKDFREVEIVRLE
jgi:proteasome lid subunit RPN8/RPN11